MVITKMLQADTAAESGKSSEIGPKRGGEGSHLESGKAEEGAESGASAAGRGKERVVCSVIPFRKVPRTF